MNIVFLKLIMSAMSQMSSGGVLVWLVFVVALTRVARKIDSHIGKIGLNPAQTGNGIGSRLPGMMTMVAVRTMGSLVSKSMSSAKGGTGKSGRGGAGGTSRPHTNPNGPRPSGSTGGNTYNGGMNVNTGNTMGANVNTSTTKTNTNSSFSGSTTNTSKTSSGAQQPGHTTGANTIHAGGKGGATVNQGAHTVGQQGAVHENVSNKGSVQRPPIPRSTSGSRPQGAKPMTDVVNGGQVNVGQAGANTHNTETHRKGNITRVGTPIGNNPPSNRVNRNVSGSVTENGNTSVQTNGNVHGRSDVRNTAVKGGNVSGNASYKTENGGNVGGVNVNGKNISGMNVGGANTGSTNISGGVHSKTEHSHSERNTDRSSENFKEKHSKNMQLQTEVRKEHEYKHGRYNPAASNTKVKKTYYQKDNPNGYRQNRNSQTKRGGNNRTTKPKQ